MAEVLEAAGADEVAAALSEQFTRIRIGPAGADHRLRIAQDRHDRMTVGRLTCRTPARLLGDPLGAVCIARLRSGRTHYRIGALENRWERGDVYVTGNPLEPFELSTDDVDVDFAMLDTSLFAELAGGADGATDDVRLTGFTPVSEQAATRWMRTLHFVRSISAPGAASLPSLAATQAARLLASVALATFPNNAVTEPTAADRHDGHPATLRRATAFIEMNADLDLTIADIARAAYVTPRALQLAFRRYLNTTPMAYLRTVRLDRAHEELRAASPDDGVTVTSIAFRWGFTQHSAFTAHYRAAFGRPPSETLHD